MFHKSFKNKPGNVVHQTDKEDPSDSECEDEPTVSITEEDNEPASPGMEHMLKEMNDKNKRIPKNVKFNISFDIVKLRAKNLKDCPNKVFDVYLKCFQNFANI